MLDEKENPRLNEELARDMEESTHFQELKTSTKRTTVTHYKLQSESIGNKRIISVYFGLFFADLHGSYFSSFGHHFNY